MHDIGYLRKEIDNIDSELIKLFEKRMELSHYIGEYKKEKNLPIFDEKREKELIKDRLSRLSSKQLSNDLELFFDFLLSLSKKEQSYILKENSFDNIFNGLEIEKAYKENPKVVYQGVEGSNGEQALVQHFEKFSDKLAVSTFEEVCQAVTDNRADYGILPIENSSTGSINDTFDLLEKYDCFIVGEETVRITHALLGTQDADIEGIKEVYSHNQGLSQCGEYLKKHSDWLQIPLLNTAGSAKYVADMRDKSKAAIASERAGQIYKLKLLEGDIHSNKSNFTRFIVIARKMIVTDISDKISIVISLSHTSGTLHRTLSYFANSGLNLVKIESRPIWDTSFEYLFFIDFSGNIFDENVKKVLSDVTNDCHYFKFLGNYKAFVLK